jgi:hypothetical protein
VKRRPTATAKTDTVTFALRDLVRRRRIAAQWV